MRTIDLSPLYRSLVGFDRLADQLDAAARTEAASGYPPYNIERTGENDYRIEIAVAGFKPEDLNIEVKENLLTVTGSKAANDDGRKFLHRGLAEDGVQQWVHREEHRQAEQAQAVQQGVEDIDPNGRPALGLPLCGPPALQRREQQHHQHELDQAHQQPAGGRVAVFQQVALPRVEQQGLHHRFEQGLLELPESIGEGLDDQVVEHGPGPFSAGVLRRYAASCRFSERGHGPRAGLALRRRKSGAA